MPTLELAYVGEHEMIHQLDNLCIDTTYDTVHVCMFGLHRFYDQLARILNVNSTIKYLRFNTYFCGHDDGLVDALCSHQTLEQLHGVMITAEHVGRLMGLNHTLRCLSGGLYGGEASLSEALCANDSLISLSMESTNAQHQMTFMSFEYPLRINTSLMSLSLMANQYNLRPRMTICLTGLSWALESNVALQSLKCQYVSSSSVTQNLIQRLKFMPALRHLHVVSRSCIYGLDSLLEQEPRLCVDYNPNIRRVLPYHAPVWCLFD